MSLVLIVITESPSIEARPLDTSLHVHHSALMNRMLFRGMSGFLSFLFDIRCCPANPTAAPSADSPRRREPIPRTEVSAPGEWQGDCQEECPTQGSPAEPVDRDSRTRLLLAPATDHKKAPSEEGAIQGETNGPLAVDAEIADGQAATLRARAPGLRTARRGVRTTVFALRARVVFALGNASSAVSKTLP